uniref:Uncharacterized protein n=1 Tax=Spumella elongata TaxID=89044 RepID=A0A7S3H3B7_9STRA
MPFSDMKPFIIVLSNGSCPIKLLHGKARIVSPLSPYLSCSVCNSEKLTFAKPQADAVFTRTYAFDPRNLFISTGSLSRLSTVKLKMFPSFADFFEVPAEFPIDKYSLQ